MDDETSRFIIKGKSIHAKIVKLIGERNTFFSIYITPTSKIDLEEFAFHKFESKRAGLEKTNKVVFQQIPKYLFLKSPQIKQIFDMNAKALKPEIFWNKEQKSVCVIS